MTTQTPPSPPSPADRGGRSCSNCACYFEQVDQNAPGLPIQGFCQRNGAIAYPYDTQRPKLDAKGQPLMMISRKRVAGPIPDPPVPQMETVREIGYLFAAMKAELVCFDGWRPIGTLPGERTIDAVLRRSAPALRAALKKAGLPDDVAAPLLAWMGVLEQLEQPATESVN